MKSALHSVGPSHANVAEGKEFDPLSTQRSISNEENAQSQNKVMSSFGIGSEGQRSILATAPSKDLSLRPVPPQEGNPYSRDV
nr:hypothetical protein BaRGS_001892 [Batillaria attramentaria]